MIANALKGLRTQGQYRLLSGQLKRFLGVGLLATSVHFLILIGCAEFLALSVTTASALGFILSLALNYWLNRNYTFSSNVAHSTAVTRFCAVAGMGLLINTIGMALLSGIHWLPYLLAQCVTTGVVLVWNFLCNALWTFRSSEKPCIVQPDGSRQWSD